MVPEQSLAAGISTASSDQQTRKIVRRPSHFRHWQAKRLRRYCYKLKFEQAARLLAKL